MGVICYTGQTSFGLLSDPTTMLPLLANQITLFPGVTLIPRLPGSEPRTQPARLEVVCQVAQTSYKLEIDVCWGNMREVRRYLDVSLIEQEVTQVLTKHYDRMSPVRLYFYDAEFLDLRALKAGADDSHFWSELPQVVLRDRPRPLPLAPYIGRLPGQDGGVAIGKPAGSYGIPMNGFVPVDVQEQNYIADTAAISSLDVDDGKPPRVGPLLTMTPGDWGGDLGIAGIIPQPGIWNGGNLITEFPNPMALTKLGIPADAQGRPLSSDPVPDALGTVIPWELVQPREPAPVPDDFLDQVNNTSAIGGSTPTWIDGITVADTPSEISMRD